MTGSMARARRVPAPPATVSRPALLVDGSDAEFRGLIHDLIAYGHKLDACRDAFAAIAGISGVQYEIVMLVSRAEGLSIGEVAARLHRSGAFITIEANKLAASGILEKAADPVARRDELVAEYTERFANPYIAAERGYIDEVIEPQVTRPRLIQALVMCVTKREVRPPRKHGNIPL